MSSNLHDVMCGSILNLLLSYLQKSKYNLKRSGTLDLTIIVNHRMEIIEVEKALQNNYGICERIAFIH